MKEENVTIFSTPVEARERSMYGRAEYLIIIVMQTTRAELAGRTERFRFFQSFASLALTAESSLRPRSFDDSLLAFDVSVAAVQKSS